MKAKSIKGKSAEEIQLELKQSMADGFKPTLAIVFISVMQNRQAITALLDAADIQIFGATTAGEFIDGEIEHGTIAILLIDINPSYFQVLLEEYHEKDIQLVSSQMAKKALATFPNPAFIIAHGVIIPGEFASAENIIRGIETIMGAGATIWGGVAGDDKRFTESFVFSNKQSSNKGIIMLVFDADKVTVKGQAASGWKAVGTEKVITRAEKNWIHELDHQPATDLVLKFLGMKIGGEEAESFSPALTVFSLQRRTGAPVMRTSGFFNLHNKSIAIDGQISEGEKLRLTLPPDFEMIDEVTQEATQFQKNEMPEADAMIMFSCIGRESEFGPLVSDEINGIKNALGAPMAGFFSYGEFGRATNGNNEYHNMTCCWVALKEKIK